jgi:hypothetical protein
MILVALLAALAITACGSNSNGAKTTASNKNAAATSTTQSGGAARSAFTACLKQHGVTLPQGRAGGFGGGDVPPTGTSPSGGPPTGGYPGAGGGFAGGAGAGGAGFAGGSSKFAKAFQACRAKLPGGFRQGGFGPGAGRAGGGNFRARFSIPELKAYVACVRKNGYPQMPEPNTSGKSTSTFPASVTRSAKFQAANRKCVSILRQAIRPPAAGGQATTANTSSTSNA